MLFQFNLFNYRTEKECDNVYDAYDHLMQLIIDFSIDMETAEQCYTVREYMHMFGLSECQLGNRWKDTKDTGIRHCNFGLVSLGMSSFTVPLTKVKA
ncbi:MAG: hypothetical protein DRN30_03165, partial [Thermoplasmata archaeon]